MTRRGIDNSNALARVVGVSHTNTRAWLDGSQTPSIEALRKVSAALGIPLLRLMVAAGHLRSDEIGEQVTVTAEPIPEFEALRRKMLARFDRGEIDKSMLDQILGMIDAEEESGRRLRDLVMGIADQRSRRGAG